MKNKTIVFFALIFIASGSYWYIHKKMNSDANDVLAPKETFTNSLTAIKVKGNVSIEINQSLKPLSQGDQVSTKGKIITAADSLVIFGFGHSLDSKIKIGPDTIVNLSKFALSEEAKTKEGFVFNLLHGSLLSIINNPKKNKILKITAKNFSMGIRGTTFAVKADDERSLLLVKEGAVEVQTENGTTKLANTGSGFLASSPNELERVDTATYHVDWNVESESSILNDSLVASSQKEDGHFIQELEKFRDNFFEQVAEKEKIVNAKSAAVIDIDSEVKLIASDKECISERSDCIYQSEFTKSQAMILRRSDSFHLSEVGKKSFIADLEKEIDRLNKEKEKRLLEIRDLNIIADEFKARAEKLNEKWSKLKSTTGDDKKQLLNEIVEIIDSNELRALFTKENE